MPTSSEPRGKLEARLTDSGRRAASRSRRSSTDQSPAVESGRPLPQPAPKVRTAQAVKNFRPRTDDRINERQGPVKPVRNGGMSSNLYSDNDDDQVIQLDQARRTSKSRLPTRAKASPEARGAYYNDPPRMIRTVSVGNLPQFDIPSAQKTRDRRSNFSVTHYDPNLGLRELEDDARRNAHTNKLDNNLKSSSEMCPQTRSGISRKAATTDGSSSLHDNHQRIQAPVASRTPALRTSPVPSNTSLREEARLVVVSDDSSDSSHEMHPARHPDERSMTNHHGGTTQSSRYWRPSSPNQERVSIKGADRPLSQMQITHKSTSIGDPANISDRSLVSRDVIARPSSGRRASIGLGSATRDGSAVLGGNSWEDPPHYCEREVDGSRRERRESVGNGSVARQISQSGYGPLNTVIGYDKLTRSNRGLVGLLNLGNTCFMNSILQCLSHTRPLLQYCLSGDYRDDLNTVTSRMKGDMIKVFASLMESMWSANSVSIVSPVNFKNQISKFARRFVGFRLRAGTCLDRYLDRYLDSEQDAHELLVYLLEGLHEDINRVREKRRRHIDCGNEVETIISAEKAELSWRQYLECEDSRIVDIFVGQLKSALKCDRCGYVSNTFEPFLELSLPIKRGYISEVSLQDCFEMFTQEETLDRDNRPMCAKCECRQKCKKRFSIQRFPQILVIHLKRFNQGAHLRTKLKTEVNCPLNGLELGRFSSDEGPRTVTYSLYAVSNHTGTPMSGHYTAHAKHPFTHQWHYFNDARVISESLTRVNTSDAYLLFYERQS